MSALAALFPEGDCRFHLGLSRGDAAVFFKAGDPKGRLLAERRHWLAVSPGRYARLLRGGRAPLHAFLGEAGKWGLAVPDGPDPLLPWLV